MKKKTYAFKIDPDTLSNIEMLAEQQNWTPSFTTNKILTDAFDGTTINKRSIVDWANANPKATAQQLLSYFKLVCIAVTCSALMASCSTPVYQVKFTDNGANNVYRPVTKLIDLKKGDTVEIVNGKKLRAAVVVSKLKGGKRG